MQVWEELVKWSSSPLGSAVVGGVAVAAIVAIASAISRGVRSAVAALFRWVFSIRLTTTGRIHARVRREIEDLQRHVVPPRWIIGRRKNGERNEWTVINAAMDSVARAVTVDTLSNSFTFLSSADWSEVEPMEEYTFFGKQEQYTLATPLFAVTWTDQAGKRRTTQVQMFQG
jgi:hypothetical protein